MLKANMDQQQKFEERQQSHQQKLEERQQQWLMELHKQNSNNLPCRKLNYSKNNLKNYL